MARLKIFTITQNEDILRQVSKELDPSLLFQKDWQEFINDFKETMYAADGVGLAAPQVGKNLRLIAIDIEGEPLVMVNPQITKKSWLRATAEEGCLSVPKIYGPVKRHKKITVKFIDEKGKQQKNIYRDLAARVIQHEVDHLDGVLFIDKISK
ncbi:peptide deformylase [Candidatus Kuenenbacteria bacterium]|nr:peptide deformylase [Candidatus Kuenenbacteria bacterium]